ncbi:ribokinase [Undibacterium sp. Ji22W]|uniref:ribokinase n=1 Tax=Undibacterium sp. Ji22W TaxID=3413038 RepID=UPI003BF06F35
MKPQIAVVGSVNMDLIFKTPRMPVPGETLMGHSFHQVHGGKGANQAVAAARMGADVHFVACVGDDVNGQSCLQALAQDGIRLDHIRVMPDTATGVAGILLDDTGQNCIVLTTGANALLNEADIAGAGNTIGQAKLLLCQLETPLNTVVHALHTAQQANVKVVLNPAPAQSLSDQILAQVDYLVLNETEAAELSGLGVTDVESAAAAAAKLQQRGASVVLVTLGALGMWVAASDASYFLPAFKVEVVDTTAAGDTFVGSFAVAIAEGKDLRSACMLAQSAAALAVTKFGAQTSIPTREAVELQLSKK